MMCNLTFLVIFAVFDWFVAVNVCIKKTINHSCKNVFLRFFIFFVNKKALLMFFFISPTFFICKNR